LLLSGFFILLSFGYYLLSMTSPIAQDQSFPKEQKLKSRKLIGQIFSEGHGVKSYPLRAQFIFHEMKDMANCQMGVSVPKRNFKRAVDRNRIKRQIKEAYRLERAKFIGGLSSADKHIAIMFIYTGREFPKYDKLVKSVSKCLSNIKF